MSRKLTSSKRLVLSVRLPSLDSAINLPDGGNGTDETKRFEDGLKTQQEYRTLTLSLLKYLLLAVMMRFYSLFLHMIKHAIAFGSQITLLVNCSIGLRMIGSLHWVCLDWKKVFQALMLKSGSEKNHLWGRLQGENLPFHRLHKIGYT
ncbi:hypothetical protein Pyn_40274 [Prunus yedoensis var. nudiflora]|uniref:Uncharacterized protein n=1 Tax=Prunus yedoensis var. nudiflora TaxID=2094558 RepID=A0A314ULX3_PRUYE|nr:hypothetical protein Pyn_40274 [Prunus yedoensis var. nudiflora]